MVAMINLQKLQIPFALCALLAMSACQTASGDFCQIARPQRPSVAEIEAMSDARVAEVLAHNKKGSRLCGWKS